MNWPLVRSMTKKKPFLGACRRSEEHTSELQSQSNLVCRLLLEKKNNMRAAQSHLKHPASLQLEIVRGANVVHGLRRLQAADAAGLEAHNRRRLHLAHLPHVVAD